MQYISVRLSGIWAPKRPQIEQILSVLEDPARIPVFVHCRRGDDRLGMVIAWPHPPEPRGRGSVSAASGSQ